MDLKKTVQIVEIVGGVGILISLIVLIIEVRANTNATQLSNVYSAVALSSTSEQWLSDSEFATTYGLGLRDFSALDDTQRIQFLGFVGQKLNVWEFTFYSYEQGLIADDAWNAWEGYFKSQMKLESWRHVWATNKRDAYQGPFQVYVDTILASD